MSAVLQMANQLVLQYKYQIIHTWLVEKSISPLPFSVSGNLVMRQITTYAHSPVSPKALCSSSITRRVSSPRTVPARCWSARCKAFSQLVILLIISFLTRRPIECKFSNRSHFRLIIGFNFTVPLEKNKYWQEIDQNFS